MIGLIVVLLTFLNGEYVFTSMESRCYTRKMIWNLRAKLYCSASRNLSVRRFHYRGLILGI